MLAEPRTAGRYPDFAADAADAIYNGYAFTLDSGNVRVLNLNAEGRAAVISREGEVLETSMDDIEMQLVLEYYARVSKYLEA